MSGISHTLVSDYLATLKVPHSKEYTKQRFDSMAFKTLFGVCNLLKEYGVEATGYRYADNKEILSLPVPFIAQTKGGMIIVTATDEKTAEMIIRKIEDGLQ